MESDGMTNAFIWPEATYSRKNTIRATQQMPNAAARSMSAFIHQGKGGRGGVPALLEKVPEEFKRRSGIVHQPVFPMTIKGKTSEDDEQADGRAAGAFDPDVDGEGESSEDENSGNPGIAPAAIWTREIGMRF